MKLQNVFILLILVSLEACGVGASDVRKSLRPDNTVLVATIVQVEIHYDSGTETSIRDAGKLVELSDVFADAMRKEFPGPKFQTEPSGKEKLEMTVWVHAECNQKGHHVQIFIKAKRPGDNSEWAERLFGFQRAGNVPADLSIYLYELKAGMQKSLPKYFSKLK